MQKGIDGWGGGGFSWQKGGGERARWTRALMAAG